MTAPGADVALADIVAQLGGELAGGTNAAAVRVDRIGGIDGATASTITFLSSPRLRPLLDRCAAGCVIVAPELREAAVARGAAIVTPDPYLYYARLTQWWAARTRPIRASGVHASAVVDPSARIGAGATIGPLAVIEAAAQVGEG
ncbi:MAG: LpxD N-terminal domain-containing protein, partial [Rhizobacter sp.]